MRRRGEDTRTSCLKQAPSTLVELTALAEILPPVSLKMLAGDKARDPFTHNLIVYKAPLFTPI
jgi:hypothetical protein